MIILAVVYEFVPRAMHSLRENARPSYNVIGQIMIESESKDIAHQRRPCHRIAQSLAPETTLTNETPPLDSLKTTCLTSPTGPCDAIGHSRCQ